MWPYLQHIWWMTKIICFLTICFLTICFYRRVRLIYFCRYADFKLQRNKVQSQKFSLAVMENFDTEFIASLLNDENTIEEASLIIQDMSRIKGSSRLGTWNTILQNMEHKRGHSKIRLTTWLQRQSKRQVLEAGIIRCVRCNLSPHCYF